MAKTEQQHREDIVQIGRLMYEHGWIAANDGNVSVRLGPDRILATPAGVRKGMLDPADMIVCDLNGHKISGGDKQPTTEMGMHLTIYHSRDDVQAVVHAHPPTATGFAVAGRALDQGVLPEAIVSLGFIPLAEYGIPGTPALSEGMMPYVEKYDAMLLANHGAVAYGEDVFKAYARLETVEHVARITLVAELLGGAKVLPRVEIEKLFAARVRYGVNVRNRFEPGAPLCAEDMPDPAEKIEMTREQLLSVIDEALRVRGVV